MGPETGDALWQPHFAELADLFAPLRSVASGFSRLNEWPTLEQINQALTVGELPVRVVPQDGRPACFEDHYEPRIYLKGELQTRLRNWHDFFNALVWLRFPETKAELNRQHYAAARRREANSNRSPIENALTRFDECGAVLVSARADLLALVREHAWNRLFWDERDCFDTQIRCVVFGHATYEKALTPYLGMTTSTVLLHEPALLTADHEQLDSALADWWRTAAADNTVELCPFPVLGVPGWHADNDQPAFYDNARYFRPKRAWRG